MIWEYLVLNLGSQPPSGLKGKLDEQGREGWELAAVLGEPGGTIGIFKRSLAREANVR